MPPLRPVIIYCLEFLLKIEINALFNILYYKTNREALTVLCSVVKHLRSGLRTLPLPSCSSSFQHALQQK